jgi:hypothetical protein
MKYSIAASTLLALQIQNSAAFAPSTFIKPSAATSITQRSAVDPSIFADVHQHADTLSSFFSSINLADAADEAVNAATSVAATAAPAVEQASSSGNGWFGFLEAPIEFLLGVIHSTLTGVGMSENSWGVTIIVMVVIIKLATYPLTKQQLTSTNKMQVSLCFIVIVSRFVRYATRYTKQDNSEWNGSTVGFFRIYVERVLCINISTCLLLNHECCHHDFFHSLKRTHMVFSSLLSLLHSIPFLSKLGSSTRHQRNSGQVPIKP